MKTIQLTDKNVIQQILSSTDLSTYRKEVVDFNLTHQSGYYTVIPKSLNRPDNSYGYGSLLVFKTAFTVQIYIPHLGYNNNIYLRVASETKVWGDWVNIRG